MIKYEIKSLFFPIDCYNYYVEEWRSVDSGKTFWYCGHGRYCKTLEEAKAYISTQSADF